MLSVRSSSSSSTRSRNRRRNAAMSPAAALLLLHGISGTNAADSTTTTNNNDHFRLFTGRINMLDYVASKSENATSAAVKVAGPPTGQPSAIPTALPTAEPTPLPTNEPTPLPTTAEPTHLPTTAEPTALPTVEPTTAEPTPLPTKEPTPLPTTAEPTHLPTTAEPTPLPTVEPTTAEPTPSPTNEPTPLPSVEPTPLPTTAEPTPSPTTAEPTPSPSVEPTSLPTPLPTTAEPTPMPPTTASPTAPLRTASNIQSPTAPAPLPATAQPTAKPTQLKKTKFIRWNNLRGPLGECEGDCDNDNECAGDLICFKRAGHEEIPGCTGGKRDADYCIPPAADTAISTLSGRTSVSSVPTPIPTAKPAPAQAAQKDASNLPKVKFIKWNPTRPLNECEGDCDKDHHCADGLVCYQRGANEEVPGCTGGKSDNSRTDYCIRPAADTAPLNTSSPTPLPTIPPLSSVTPGPTALPTPVPTQLPTPAPTVNPTSRPVQVIVQENVSNLPNVKFVHLNPNNPLNECEGDCDNDNQCAGDLICHQREFGNEEVPGCTGGKSDNSRTDYCIRPAADTASPTTSSSPTPQPTISSMPSVSSVPSVEPSLNPTPAPTVSSIPSVQPTETQVSEKFRLRLYWHKSYFWQETRRETFWCWQCRGGCKNGNLIEIDHCSQADYFQWYAKDDTYRPASNPDLCVTEEGFDSESKPLRLRKCNGGNKQKWVNQGWKDPSISFNFDKQPWEIHPYSNMNKCVTQMHHPKAHERVFIRSCEKPRKHDTSQWVTYK